MTIPAIPPPPPPPQRGYEPGTIFGDLTCVLDDSQGSGAVITFGMADADRTAWRVTSLEGWDSPDLPEAAENKTGADGAWDAENFFAARQISIGGLIQAPSQAAKDAAKTRLAQATPARGRLVTFTVNETIPKQVTARRSGRLLMGDLTDTVVEFSATLLAVDPRKYATGEQNAAASLGAPGAGVMLPLLLPAVLPEREAGGEFFTVVNDGTDETPPLIRIVGPGRNLGIANLTTGQALTYPFELATGDELVIDTVAGAAQFNGTAFRAPAAGSEVVARFLLPPGTSQMQFLGSRTDVELTPLLSMSWRSAWM